MSRRTPNGPNLTGMEIRSTFVALALSGLFATSLTGCGGDTMPSTAQPEATSPVATDGSQSSAPSSRCTLVTKRDMLIRMVSPNLPVAAQRIGDVDLAHCKTTLETFATSQPMAAGFCTQIAWADDNPGYDENARPAPALKKVLQEVGPAC